MPTSQQLPQETFVAFLSPQVIHRSSLHDEDMLREVLEQSREDQHEKEREDGHWQLNSWVRPLGLGRHLEWSGAYEEGSFPMALA